MNADGYPGDRRRHQRYTRPPLCLSFEGHVHAASDWSLGGFVVADYEGALSPGSLFVVDAIGVDPAALTPVSISARIVRVNEDRRVVTASFLVIDQPAFALLQKLIGERTTVKEASPSR
ncbi:MAG: hypothetical protein JNM75_09925 [Rhodospirillales bacterium]|nr:hypothetical protein [Rhodospirillales bacterium]